MAVVAAERGRGTALAEVARELAQEGFTPHYRELQERFSSRAPWRALREMGTDLWLDSADLAEIEPLWTREFTHCTTNNFYVNVEVQRGRFDEAIPQIARRLRAAEPALSEQELIYEVGFVLNCRVALSLVERLDATVSVELHPAFADDVPTSVAYGVRYYAVCPERFLVKVPLTPAGYLAARHLGERGVPVNFTLGFSARQNYLAAHLARTRYVNVFMGRLNAFVKDNGLGSGDNVGERATQATQVALRAFREREGRDRPLLIGASMRNAGQVAALAGLDVFTIPTKVAAAFVAEMEAHPQPLTPVFEREFPVPLAPGVDERRIGLPNLWEISDAYRAFVAAVDREDVSNWTGADLIAFARDHRSRKLSGFRDWSEEERKAVEADGKIPNYARWAADLAAGTVALDDLMSISALHSFAVDQRELDTRIARLLAAGEAA
ncbi:MAG: transaldolase [Armatimonadetes bacterium]|nr:transaldolase [Armatimonadota bacterium]